MDIWSSHLKLNVPSIIVIISFVVVCIADLCFMSTKRNNVSHKRVLIWSLLIEYVFLILCSTVFCREVRPDFNIEITPFWSYPAFINGRRDLLPEVILNIFIFIPIGFALSALVKNVRCFRVLVLSFGFSLSIELLQLIFKRGLCEVDDLIHNTLGAYIGFLCYSVFMSLIKQLYGNR